VDLQNADLENLSTQFATYASNFAVYPDPPVAELHLMRTNFARTVVTVRASPAVAVLVSSVVYSESTSAIADCSERLIAVGAVPKIVCQRTVRSLSGNPADCGKANCAPDVPPAGASFEKLKPMSPGKRLSGGFVLLYVGIIPPENLCCVMQELFSVLTNNFGAMAGRECVRRKLFPRGAKRNYASRFSKSEWLSGKVMREAANSIYIRMTV
jgi:hypothetical protein